MGIVYHGSKIHNLRTIKPHKSTHGEYVYATPFREIAILYSKRCGEDTVYGFGKTSKSKCFDLVERIPDAFKYMYTTDSSIYTLDDSTFKNINTTFGSNEVVSDKEVKVIDEEYIPNLLDEIDKLELNGFIKIYRYPSRPERIPSDDADLLEKKINNLNRKGIDINKNSLKWLIYLHPNLLEKVNKVLQEMDKDTITDEDMIEIYNHYKERTDIETYFDSAYKLLKKYYPEIAMNINKDNEFKVN